MRPQLIMFCFGVFICGTLLSLGSTGRWFSGAEIDIINQLAGFNAVKMEILGGWTVAKSVVTWFNAMVNMFSWNYPFLANPWGTVLKLVFLYPVTVGVVITILEVASSVIQGIAASIRSLFPV